MTNITDAQTMMSPEIFLNTSYIVYLEASKIADEKISTKIVDREDYCLQQLPSMSFKRLLVISFRDPLPGFEPGKFGGKPTSRPD